MKTGNQTFLFFFSIVMIILSGCGNIKNIGSDTQVALSPTLIELSTATPIPSPTPIDNNKSYLIYKNEKDISLNLTDFETGKTKVLITAEELIDLLPNDKGLELFGFDTLDQELSPDGTKSLASVCAEITSSNQCIYENFIINLLEKSIYPLTISDAKTSDGIYSIVSWSPDSKKIALFSEIYLDENINKADLMILDVSTASLILDKELDSNAEDYIVDIVWSRDSKFIYPIYHTTNSKTLKMINIETSQEQNITIEGADPSSHIICMQFAPNGEKVGFMISNGFEEAHYQIHIANSDFTNLEALDDFDSDHFNCSNFEWSPNQKYILTELQNVENEKNYLDYNELVFDVKTGKQIGKILSAPAEIQYWYDPITCGWAPNGDLIVYKFKEKVITETPTPDKLLELFGMTETPGAAIEYENAISLLNIFNSSETTFDLLNYCPTLWIPKDQASPELVELFNQP